MKHRIAPHLPAVFLLGFVAAACSADDDDDDSFTVRRTTVATFDQTPVAVGGRWIAFLAAEDTTGAGGTNFNQATGDVDKNDRIAVVVDTSSNVETNLAVAVAFAIEEPLAWTGDHLYLAVDEALDTKDWNLDGDQASPDDLVLLRWTGTAAPPTLTYVDDLIAPPAGARALIGVGTNLYYASATAAPDGPGESSLRMIASADPLTSVEVPTRDLLGPLAPSILGADEGLLFLSLDESDFGGRILNGDATADDAFVLALFDAANAAISAGVPTKSIRSTGLAVDDADAPWRAKKVATADWQVGFLVSEAAQGENLNDPADFSANWQPTQCGTADADTADQVLHFLFHEDWDADPITNRPEGTGLPGVDQVAIANGFVATVSPEGDAGCDLNSDGDSQDRIVRWTQLVTPGNPVLPPRDAVLLRALPQAADVPGGTFGLAELDNRFVIVVSETEENEVIYDDGNPLTFFDLVAHLSPSASQPSAQWDFTHSSGNTFVGATWLGETPDRAWLGMGFEERVIDGNPNTVDNINGPGSSAGPPTADDPDLNDGIITFPNMSGSTLIFPGVKIAVDKDNAGVVVARSIGFYRVSEAEDSRDWNGDGDENDFVLFRTSLSESTSAFTAPIAGIERPAVLVNGTEASPITAAFLTDEQAISTGTSDLNGDGDSLDLVLQYFRF